MLYHDSIHNKPYDDTLYVDKEEEIRIVNENAIEELKQADPDDIEDIQQIFIERQEEIEEIESED